MVNKTCDIRIRDAPTDLRIKFKELCVRNRRSYREMLSILIDSYEKGKVIYA